MGRKMVEQAACRIGRIGYRKHGKMVVQAAQAAGPEGYAAGPEG
jgi:hypothetical protein